MHYILLHVNAAGPGLLRQKLQLLLLDASMLTCRQAGRRTLLVHHMLSFNAGDCQSSIHARFFPMTLGAGSGKYGSCVTWHPWTRHHTITSVILLARQVLTIQAMDTVLMLRVRTCTHE